MASETFGVREFVNLFLLALQFYLRHKENIDDLLPGDLPAHMNALVDAMDTIRALNLEGPL